MTRAVLYDGAGSATRVLRVGDVADPGEPADGRILVRVTAFPVHPGDLQAVAGPFRGRPGTPMIAGLEATGVVEAIGPGTAAPPGVVVGGRVTLIHSGAWSERVIADISMVAAVPPDVPDDHAAQMLINPLTAQLLRRATQRSPATGYTDGGILVAYSALDPEPVPLHYRDLQRGLTITNVNVGRWSTITSPQQRAWDIETAVAMVQQHPDQLDVAAHYDLHEIAVAAEHATRPRKVGVIVVHP